MTNRIHPSQSDTAAFRIALVSTCPPRQCGIATFTSDLADAIEGADSEARVAWAAIDEEESMHVYGPAVRWRLDQHRPATYREVALQLNSSNMDVVSVQHEFGLYGEWGDTFEDYLAPFLDALRKPLVTTLHTVLPEPSPSVRIAVRRIGASSSAVIVMANAARDILERDYGIDLANVHVIPHGTPPIGTHGRAEMKTRLGFDHRRLITTFGLLDPRKGIEYMIRAMPEIARLHPDALYLVLGKTHPDLARRAGEAYRAELVALAHEHGVEDHVAFVDEYLSQQQIIDYLVASDVYVTPYLDLRQITSGTLAYALGAGKAIVSTPYAHAREALAEDRGIVVGVRNHEALSEAVCGLLQNDMHREQLEGNAYDYGRRTEWANVGREVVDLYRRVARPRIEITPHRALAAATPVTAGTAVITDLAR